MGLMKLAIGDGVITFMWMFCVSTVGPATAVIAKSLGLDSAPAVIAVSVVVIAVLILIFGPISEAMGGASFNPANSACFYAAGFGGDTVFSLAVRLPAQAMGAVLGVLAIKEVMPSPYKAMLRGPFLKVDLHTGAMAEGILGFLLSFAVLFIIIKGPKNPIIRSFCLAATTVSLVFTGSGYTGPSLNPINAYSWAYANDRHNSWEHFYVYWIPSFVGAIVAAYVFKFIFMRPAVAKVKKA